MPTYQLSDLERVGDSQPGDATDPNPQTLGGQTDLVFSRTYKILGSSLANYLFQIKSTTVAPATRITDATITSAYLVAQKYKRIDEVNGHLICVFAQIPSTWSTDHQYQTIPFPGVQQSSLYTPYDFEFRPSAASFSTQIRYEHAYFLGPANGIATRPRFKPTNNQGYRTSVITDDTNPTADQYISMVNGRQELVIESVVLPWKGDIFVRRTLFALAK